MGMRILSLFKCFKDSGMREIICRGEGVLDPMDSVVCAGYRISGIDGLGAVSEEEFAG
jgi:hypothetical protein